MATGLSVLFVVCLLIPTPPGLESFQFYLPLHSLMEMIAIIIAVLVFVVGWNSRQTLGITGLPLLACGFLAVAILDFIHTFTIEGMPGFFTEPYAGRGILFWLAARYAAALSLLAFVWVVWKRSPVAGSNARLLMAVLLLTACLVWIGLFNPHWLPAMRIPGQGLTQTKIVAEYLLFGIHLITAIGLWRLDKADAPVHTRWLAVAVWIMGLSELFFTLYVKITDFYNIAGHLYKVIAYAIIYWAVFVQVLREPYQRLRQSQAQLQVSEARLTALVDSAMDAIIVVDAAHCIVMFNAAAAKMFGHRQQDVLGKAITELIPVRYRAEHDEQMQRFAAEGSSARPMGRFGQITGRRADGSEFPAEAAIARISTPHARFFSVTLHDVSARETNQKAVRQSEERYHTLLKNLPGAVYRCELKAPWRASFLSDGVEKLTGYPAGEFMREGGVSLVQLIVPEDLPGMELAMQQAITQHRQYDVRYRILHADQSVRWLQECGQAIFDDAGEPIQLEGVVIDITERVRGRLELERSHAELEQRVVARTGELAVANADLNEAQRLAQLGSWQLDLITNHLKWSDEIFRIFEIDPEKFGASYEAFLKLVHSEDRDLLNQVYAESVAKHTAYEFEHRLVMPDGRIKYVRELGQTEYASDGTPLRSIGTVQDITAQVQLQSKLNETSQFLNSIIEHIPSMIFMKRADDLRFVLWNKAGEELVGYSRDELLGKNDYDFFSREQADFFTANDRDVLQRMGYLNIPQEVIDTRYHGKRILHTRKIALRDAQGQPQYLLGISEDITSSTEAQLELETSHRLLNAVVENTHVLIAVLDPNLNFIRVNTAYAATERKTPDFFVGKSHFDLYPNPDNEVLFRKAVHSGETLTVFAKPFEYANNPERGLTHWDWTLTPIKDAAGNVSSLVLALLDVTERINAIEALSRREWELRDINETLESRVLARTADLTAAYTFTDTVLQIVRVLILVLDRNGNIVRFNRACEETTGYTSTELIGKPVWDYLIPPEQLAGVKQVFSNLTAGLFPNRHENDWLMRDGSRRLFAWSNTCTVDEQGNVDFVIATGIDITESRRAERDLRISEGMFRELTENIREVFFLRDIQTNRMIYVSPAYETLFDQPRDALLHDPVAFLKAVYQEDMVSVVTAMKEQMEQNRYFNLEYRIVRYGYDIRWVWARTFPIYDDNGRVYRIAGLVEDITDRKRDEDQRLQQERAQRNALVREVHHRIKNNLQGVIGLLRQHVTRSPELQTPIESAITRVSTMALVHGLHSRDSQERILLCEMTEAIAANVNNLTGQPLEVRREIPQPVRVAEEEAVAVALILNELMFNAIKHADNPAGETLQVVVGLENGQAVIRMRCRGRSLPAGLDIALGIGLGTGLSLVKALLPAQATVRLHQTEPGWVETELRLAPPVIELPQ